MIDKVEKIKALRLELITELLKVKADWVSYTYIANEIWVSNATLTQFINKEPTHITNAKFLKTLCWLYKILRNENLILKNL